MKVHRLYLAVVCSALLLVGCGGGGGESSAQPPVAPPPSTGVASGLQVSVPAATYSSTSAEAFVFKVLNQERLRCGVGQLAQSAALDVAAAGQTNYQLLRQLEGVFGSHVQTPGVVGFTAATPADRAALAGYKGSYIGEDIAYVMPGLSADVTGDSLVRVLLATVYHQASLMDNFRDVGISVGFPEKAPVITRFPVLTMNLGHTSNSGPQEPTDVVTYPCEGSSGVQPSMAAESPDPFAGMGFTAGSNVGHPILVRASSGKVVRLTSATISSGSKNVQSSLYHVSDDRNGLLKPYQAFVVPREALSAATTYQVIVTGTVDGSAFSRAFAFTTRSTQ